MLELIISNTMVPLTIFQSVCGRKIQQEHNVVVFVNAYYLKEIEEKAALRMCYVYSKFRTFFPLETPLNPPGGRGRGVRRPRLWEKSQPAN